MVSLSRCPPAMAARPGGEDRPVRPARGAGNNRPVSTAAASSFLDAAPEALVTLISGGQPVIFVPGGREPWGRAGFRLCCLRAPPVKHPRPPGHRPGARPPPRPAREARIEPSQGIGPCHPGTSRPSPAARRGLGEEPRVVNRTILDMITSGGRIGRRAARRLSERCCKVGVSSNRAGHLHQLGQRHRAGGVGAVEGVLAVADAAADQQPSAGRRPRLPPGRRPRSGPAGSPSAPRTASVTDGSPSMSAPTMSG
jgi:hypothetical protein